MRRHPTIARIGINSLLEHYSGIAIRWVRVFPEWIFWKALMAVILVENCCHWRISRKSKPAPDAISRVKDKAQGNLPSEAMGYSIIDILPADLSLNSFNHELRTVVEFMGLTKSRMNLVRNSGQRRKERYEFLFSDRTAPEQ